MLYNVNKIYFINKIFLDKIEWLKKSNQEMLIKCLSYVKCRKNFLNERSSIKNSLKIHSLNPGSISMMKIIKIIRQAMQSIIIHRMITKHSKNKKHL